MSEENVLSSGYFITVEINSLKLDMLVDTGSPVTIISLEIAEMLGIRSSELSRVATTLLTADGNKMDIKGKVKCKMKIDKIFVEQDVIVAQLSKLKGIIGMDFFQQHKCNLKLSESKISIDNTDVKLKIMNQNVFVLG